MPESAASGTGTPLCKRCELNLRKYELANVINYSKKENNFINNALFIMKYEGIVREKLIDYKFNEKSYLYKTFSKIILKNSKIYGFLKKYDIIIPVPMSKKKLDKRGYNQTELISKEIAKKLQIGYSTGNLVKVRETNTQSLLTKNEREKNVKGAFEVIDNNEFYGKNIILFDDIYTTGMTIQECARTIKKAKPNKILVLTIAKD